MTDDDRALTDLEIVELLRLASRVQVRTLWRVA